MFELVVFGIWVVCRVVDGMVLCFVVDSWDLQVGKGDVGSGGSRMSF